jgi:PKD repeat protein
MSSRKIMLFIFVILILPVYISSPQYYLRVEYPEGYFAQVYICPKGIVACSPYPVSINDPSQTIYVSPGSHITVYFSVKVINNRGGPWITPVIGTASWTRGEFQCITSDAPSGESIQSYHAYLTAPETPGTYYIGIFAGWMYSCAEVASNDHPPQFNDGDDVWDMSQSDWESIISTGSATKYNQPGRAIRIVVQGATPPPEQVSVDVWTDRGGKGVGNYDGGTYSIGDDITFYCSVNTDVDFLKVWVEKPDGTTVVLFEGSVKAGTYEFHGKVGEPAGERRLKAYAYKLGQTAEDEAKFYAVYAGKPPTLTLFEPQVSGLTVTVNGAANPGYSGASITRINWDWGDGSSEDTWFPATHKYSSAGTYTIKVTAYQSDGLSTTKTLSVKVEAENKPPTAYIDSISPNPAYEGQTISFSGHGYDPDGKITECEWRADGKILGSSCSFTTSLPPGKYTIYFRVKDDKGAWSEWVTQMLEVKAFQFTASLSTDKTIYEKPYEVTFRIDITKGLPGHYNGRILIIDPSSETIDVINFPVDLEGSEGHIIKKWNAPENSKPGTYFAMLVLEGEHGQISCVTGFYLDDPDTSYVEVLPSYDGVKIIHIHLQRFRWIYSDELPPIDYITAMKIFRVDLVGVGLRALKNAVSAAKSMIRGVVTPAEPYDLTIISIYRAGEGYLCLIFESHPLGAINKVVKDFIMSISVKTLLKKLGFMIPSGPVPIPIEYFEYISKEDYESLTADRYTMLALPTEVIVKYVEEPRGEYKLGESISAKVQVIDPRTNEPLKGDFDAIACIGPSTYKATSICVNIKNGVLDGLYTDQIYDAFHSSEYKLYFVVFGSGYIGVSQSRTIRISSEKALFDIRRLSFSISPSSISFSESTKIYLSFDISAQVPCQVQVRILKKTFFGLFSAEIARRDARIGHNDLVISLKGEEIADKFLFWSIPGNYDIYAEITVTYIPPESTFPVSYTRTTSVSTINVHS